ncbi:MAG: protein translocase subunit SecF, partial [bacterium]|nr:protein translocase subunit SecF [bacterium]
AAIVSVMVHGGLNLGVDFTGGTLLQVHFQEPVETEEVRTILSDAGFNITEIQKIKDTGKIKNAFLIRTGLQDAVSGKGLSPGRKLAGALTEKLPQNPVTVDSDETVGPKIGKELQLKALWAVLVGLLFILIYVAYRFDFRFGVAAIISLFHDVACTIGFISITGMEFNLQSVAVLLTIVGYSINDSIVVADRIRENVKKPHKDFYPELVNRSINETLSRTMVTAVSVFLVLVALQLFSGRVLSDFTKPMLFGLLIGTYSSIFIVAAIVVDWEIKRPTKRKK